MFDRFLVADKSVGRLDLRWSVPFPALVRVPVFSPDGSGYIVCYAEKTRSYILQKFAPDSGELEWSTQLHNGGYGAIAAGDQCIAVPTGFTDITGVDSASGRILWKYRSSSRVRSPVAFTGNHFIASSGDTLFKLNELGEECARTTPNDCFFYGLPREQGRIVYSLCAVTGDFGFSQLHLCAMDWLDGLIWTTSLSDGHVVSSDTSGFAMTDDRLYATAGQSISCLDRASGTLLWSATFPSIVGRHMPILHRDRILVGSLSGQLACLDAATGKIRWTFAGQTMVTSPPSIVGDTVLVTVDGHLCLLAIKDGREIHRVPIGHAPYSAVAIRNGTAFVGAGDPPYFGRLFAFDMLPVDHKEPDYITAASSVCEYLDEARCLIRLDVRNCVEEIENVEIDAAVILGTGNQSQALQPDRRVGTGFFFAIKPSKFLVNGCYCLPVKILLRNGAPVHRTISVALDMVSPRVSKFELGGFDPVGQTHYLHSGAAVAQMIQHRFAQSITPQARFREMVDYVRERADYEPFNLWRLVFQRVFMAGVADVRNLPEYKNERA